MLPIATDGVVWSVGRFVFLSVMTVSYAKMTEVIGHKDVIAWA